MNDQNTSQSSGDDLKKRQGNECRINLMNWTNMTFNLTFGTLTKSWNTRRKEGPREKYELQVIGAGFGRTGTSSTQDALELLLNAPCYHMREAIQRDHLNFFIEWKENRNMPLERIREHFQHYASTLDLPACFLWEDLLAAYPNAKVVLNVREFDGWFKSCEETIFCSQPGNKKMPWGIWILHMLSPFFGRFHRMMWLTWGGPYFGGDYSYETSKRVFESWNAHVISKCPKDRLLVFDVRQGWEPLCKFLGKPIPDVPFPNVNEAKVMKQWVVRKNAIGYTMLGLSCVGVGAMAAGVRMFLLPWAIRMYEKKL